MKAYYRRCWLFLHRMMQSLPPLHLTCWLLSRVIHPPDYLDYIIILQGWVFSWHSACSFPDSHLRDSESRMRIETVFATSSDHLEMLDTKHSQGTESIRSMTAKCLERDYKVSYCSSQCSLDYNWKGILLPCMIIEDNRKATNHILSLYQP